MESYGDYSSLLMSAIGLKYEPVAVSIFKKGDPVPEGYQTPERPVRHCQAIMRARRGETLLVTPDSMACPVGGSSLGLLPVPDKVAAGEFHFKLGMFSSPEAAKEMIDQRPSLESESVDAVLVAPLSKARERPDVVIVTGVPEQVYWLAPAAATYNGGGRIDLSTAAFQACCADSTLIPYLQGSINMSLGCFGCRKSTDIAPEEMIVGIPFSRLPEIVKVVDKLKDGPIPKTRSK